MIYKSVSNSVFPTSSAVKAVYVRNRERTFISLGGRCSVGRGYPERLWNLHLSGFSGWSHSWPDVMLMIAREFTRWPPEDPSNQHFYDSKSEQINELLVSRGKDHQLTESRTLAALS